VSARANAESAPEDELTSLSPARAAESVFAVPLLRTCTPAELRRALREAFAADGPTIVEAVIDPSVYGDLVLRSDRADAD
jgi:thiamine pyrophosphate-dependent acetolactate synthase large subunit-like protein